MDRACKAFLPQCGALRACRLWTRRHVLA